VVAALAPLAARHPAELGRPDDQGVVEHPAGLEVLDQRRGGPVHAPAHLAVVAGDVLVRVPVAAREPVVGAAPDLDEPHSALQEPAGDQAVAAEVRRGRLVEPVEVPDGPRLAGDVQHLRGAELQPGRQLVRGDPRVEPRVPLATGPVRAVHRVEQGEAVALALGRQIGVIRWEEVEDRVLR
jgi:hypothetical protein